MDGNDKVGTYQFVAEPFHVDFAGRLTMGVLGNHLLNCAGFHAAERGFGIAELNENHYTWVLSRLAVELEDMPRAYQFTVSRQMMPFSRISTGALQKRKPTPSSLAYRTSCSEALMHASSRRA